MKIIPINLKILEIFTSFIEFKDQSVFGLKSKIIQFDKNKGLDIKKCWCQSYNRVSAMSGIYNRDQKIMQQTARHAYFKHCANHNLNSE